jgi:hypothetical protein
VVTVSRETVTPQVNQQSTQIMNHSTPETRALRAFYSLRHSAKRVRKAHGSKHLAYRLLLAHQGHAAYHALPTCEARAVQGIGRYIMNPLHSLAMRTMRAHFPAGY